MNAPTAPAALRPLRLGEILDAAIKLTIAHFATFLAVVVVATGPIYFVLITLVAVTLPEALRVDTTADEIPTPSGDELSVLIGVGVVGGIAFLIASVIATGACFQVVDDAWRGREPEWKRALATMLRRLGSLLWLSLLIGVGIALAFTVPLAAGFALGPAGGGIGLLLAMGLVAWLGVRWAFSIPALIGEGLRGTAAMRRSWSLVGGRWWRTAGVLIVGIVLASVVSQLGSLVVGLPPSLLFADNPAVLAVSQFAGYLVGAVISTPAIAAVVVVTYFDLRVRKEGYDLELRAAALEGDESPEPGARYVPEGERWTAEERAQAPYWPPPPGWKPVSSGLERGDDDAPGGGLGR